ncbi:MAG: taurine catabolism dioxygenase TauD [Candidatus Muproteobacteria bacterium RIFCSPHIGHO2_12_FULL_60_33]|uniref:Taurine catabolism dioxygenase TauD n=1 Tax=Candidatus Muproteobacteria bacterium RIFCSPLOWO2_01_FULL_60_18 TaxID=1817768 RepID=A0A1F6TY42_9PROT|nr:MAG: taurine catabolism dioxygenase TauD [Candidatus Muproteobacteria bacterium RIFCSPHIGHO2_01_60_12]OGI50054.1 MAG: taurine catabolism dioxygenase TauD [Candidatus Muproteobacteria bacterium RIFCSPLOWO2_01_FULL_60_18]OGI55105.1 MAG: taurine catabolism dioxygenase TauD [Candidatus Muproteobacteria bacterium RIFCSPHIGHO2_12_FULL_60_33]OGI56903.1 MAG: taurine catabolism dioxygenase TauD [Candidatus Muproteobacteria bacterium RIFCSPHIGHO2_02_FULL_60_13]OGI57748.1 MAG: taurine catabolism dioxyg
MESSPFYVENEAAYQRWRAAKLGCYPTTAEELVVPVDNPLLLTDAEAEAMLNVCRKTNMVIYASRARREDKEIPRAVGERFDLRRLDSNMLADDDGITSLQVVPGKSQRGYIPYSNKRLLWHTDGYYNTSEARIHAFVLHCVSPAAEGGENSLLDHEIAYILMRDANPDYIQALMAPDAMTIPANTEAGVETRLAVTGPVFSMDSVGGNLHMRYTARTRSIEWKQDAATRKAVQFLENLLAGESPYMFRHTMTAGQGLICNNVLHNRTAFADDVDRGIARLVYRARYYDRIAGTSLRDVFG